LKGLDFRSRQRADDRGDDLTEAGQDGGIDGVGFGQDAECLGEVANLPSIDHDGGQRGSEQGTDSGLLIVARRLEDDAVGAESLRHFYEFGDPGRIVGEAAFVARWQGVEVEVVLANIDAENAIHRSSEGWRYCKAGGPKASPVQAGEYGLGAPVTVRTEVSRCEEDPTYARAAQRVPARNGLILEVVRQSHNPEFNG